MYYIFYYNISFFMCCCFFVCGLYIGFSFIIVIMGIYVFYFMFVVLGSMIISRISHMMIFIFMCCMWSLALCDNYYHWLMIIFFHFLCVVLGYGYIILVIWRLLNYLYHRTGIYLFDFFFVCVFWMGVYNYPWSMMSSDLNCVCWWEM